MRSILEFFRPLQKTAGDRDSDPQLQHEEVDATLRKRPQPVVSAEHKASKRSDKPSDTDRQRSLAGNTLRKKHKVEKAAAATPLMNGGDFGISEYEMKRRARMEANAKFLRDLGLKHAQMDMAAQVQAGSSTTGMKPGAKAKKVPQSSEAPRPVRRSMRLRGEAAVVANKSLPQEGSDESDEESVEPSFDDSSVLRYTMDGAAAQMTESYSDGAGKTNRTLAGFTFASQARPLTDTMLKRIYTVSFTSFQQHGLIATGGKQGRVSIYASPSSNMPKLQDEGGKEEGDDAGSNRLPLMSFKAHSSWVSSLSLAKSVYAEKNLLLTAANDGLLKLWDLNRSSSALNTPQELLASKVQHSKGIFGMDISGDEVLTCSKDSTIAHSRFLSHADGLVVLRRFKDHDGVVKSVQFAASDTQRFASGGNDRTLRVFDMRLSETKAAALIIPDAHPRAINSVQFHPRDAHLLLSASFDPAFYLFDLRKPSSPVCTFRGGPQSGSRSDIYHPLFVREGQEVVAASGRELSLYGTSDGAVISRGDMTAKADCIAADPFKHRLLVANSGVLQFAECVWKNK